MPVDVGSILRLKVFQRLQGQTVLNVNHFLVTSREGGGLGLGGFAEAAGYEFFNTWSPLQSTGLVYVRAELDEVNGVEFDQFSFPAGAFGELSGDELPPFNAAAIRLNRQTKVTRNGAMRLAGLVEGQQTNGQFLGAPYTALQNAALAWFDNDHEWIDPISPTRVLGLINIIWGGNSPQYPEGRFSRIASVQVSSYVTTQNTRKYRAVEGA